jgi:hypothetical protein
MGQRFTDTAVGEGKNEISAMAAAFGIGYPGRMSSIEDEAQSYRMRRIRRGSTPLSPAPRYFEQHRVRIENSLFQREF